jgi:thiol-disulfide isomerase/thioredoxin
MQDASAQNGTVDVVSDESRSVPVYDFAGLRPYLSSDSDTTYVVNFWATWCAPCIEELPYFEALTKENMDKPLRVLLVSLDFRKQLKSRLLPFLKQREIQSRVLVLDDPDANSWIDQVDPAWSGAIPATLVYRGSKRVFREQTFTRDELFQLVESFMD